MRLYMAFYECTFIARADLSKADVQKITDGLTKIITDMNGTVIKNEYWGIRTLAYKINKVGKGHYTMLGIEASAEALREMERNIRINEDVVRNLTVRVDEMDATPSVMLQQRAGDSYEAA
jgi:small subunit ribosomal protein S6